MHGLIAALLAILIPLPLQADALHAPLIFQPPLAPDLASLPRLAGQDPVSTKINAALQTEDDSLLSFRQDCLQEPNSDFSATYEVTLDGPEFLSILQSREWYCNTAHGWSDRIPLIFDLKTGDAVDPASLLPAAVRPVSHDQNWASFSVEKSLASVRPLTDLYLTELASAPPNELADLNDLDCADILTRELHGFLMWPNAKTHALMLMPNDLAYVFTPCQNPVALPVALLLKLHASPRLILALAK